MRFLNISGYYSVTLSISNCIKLYFTSYFQLIILDSFQNSDILLRTIDIWNLFKKNASENWLALRELLPFSPLLIRGSDKIFKANILLRF